MAKIKISTPCPCQRTTQGEETRLENQIVTLQEQRLKIQILKKPIFGLLLITQWTRKLIELKKAKFSLPNVIGLLDKYDIEITN